MGRTKRRPPNGRESTALKALQVRLSRAESAYSQALAQEETAKQAARAAMEAALAAKSEIDRLKATTPAILVSEHAMLRYLERVKNLDLIKLQEEIVPQEVADLAAVLGDGLFPVDEGRYRLKIRGGTVVTVLPAEE